MTAKSYIAILLLFWITLGSIAITRAQDPKEDCIGFNPDRIQVQYIRGRWKIVEGNHWIMDFGYKYNEAVLSLQIIRKYRFDQICYVGRPGASMTYFKARRKITTVLILRHAEPEYNNLCEPDNPNDPCLSDAGKIRAEQLLQVARKAGVKAIFTTDFNRTRETVEPLADSLPGVQPIIYTDINALVTSILTDYNGGVILVAGHSPSVPQIVAALGGSQGDCPVNPGEFDNLCMVTVYDTGRAKVVNLQYGQPTP